MMTAFAGYLIEAVEGATLLVERCFFFWLKELGRGRFYSRQ